MNCHPTDFLSSLSQSIGQIDASSWMGLITLLGVSFLASPHCAVMCGPVAGLASSGSTFSKQSLGIYNLFRLIGYMFIGGLLGQLGGSLTMYLGPGFRQALILVLLGYSIYGLFCYWRPPFFRIYERTSQAPKACGRCIKCEKGGRRPSRLKPAFLGLFTVFIPCVSLTPALFLAAQGGQFYWGALSMLFFGLGTMPVMSGGGMLVSGLIQRVPARFHGALHPLSCLIVSIWSILTLNY